MAKVYILVYQSSQVPGQHQPLLEVILDVQQVLPFFVHRLPFYFNYILINTQNDRAALPPKMGAIYLTGAWQNWQQSFKVVLGGVFWL